MLNTENPDCQLTGTAPRRRISKTLMVASAITCLGIWQIIHVSTGGDSLFQISAKAKAGLSQPRSDRRTPPGRTLTPADPVGAYIERSKRGMTDQDIRWMIEDFQALGPMPTSGGIEESRSYRERQNRWYLLALAEALSLSSEQKRTVQKSLAEALDLAEDQYWKRGNETGGASHGVHIELYLEATHWLRTATLAPWNLCVLTEAQSALTMNRRWLEQKKAAMKMGSPFNAEPMWLTYMSIVMRDPVSGDSVAYPPPSPLDLACTLQGTIKGGIMDISDAFPLTPDQQLAGHRYDVVAQARLLQPAQLRMALFLNPSLSQTILQQLDNPRPHVEPTATSAAEPDAKSAR